MKARESGMPEQSVWDGFFDPPSILARLGLDAACRDVVDFGCGYGTFTIPAARVVSGMAHALDIEPAMIAAVSDKARQAGLTNVQTRQRDFLTEGTGLPDASVGYAMLFNLLHAEHPERLLVEARRALRPGGVLAIMHWRSDIPTPRGPSMAIRPAPAQCRTWAMAAGFEPRHGGTIDLPPYHYGLVLRRPIAPTGDR
ncbi:MAG: class I SAM-dependent methyltransferase [Phycisphaeraceae bacterium]